MRRIAPFVLASVVLAMGACRKSKPRAELPLLGRKSDAVVAHFESTCPEQFIRGEDSPPISMLSCYLPNHAAVFDEESRTTTALRISGTPAEALKIYDRAFAPIVPDETREVLRRSLIDLNVGPVFRKDKTEVTFYVDREAADRGDSVLMEWRVRYTYL